MKDLSLPKLYNSNKTKRKIIGLCACNKLHMQTYLHVCLRVRMPWYASQGTVLTTVSYIDIISFCRIRFMIMIDLHFILQ